MVRDRLDAVGIRTPDYASAVLPDGRFIVEGGEYNAGKLGLDQLGARSTIALTNKWTVSRSHPSVSGWSHIGDAPSACWPTGNS